MKIRLLHILKSLDIGGVEKSTILYANKLINNVEFIGILGPYGFFDKVEIIDKRIKRFYSKKIISYFFTNLFQIIKIINNYKITHIHYHQRIFIPYALITKLIFPRIKIIYSHQNVFRDHINYFIFADKIIALTTTAKKDLPLRLQKKTYVIPHGINLSYRIHKKVPNKDLIFSFIGRFVEWKGILDIIKAFAEINQLNNNTQLFLIGEGKLHCEIKNMVKLLDIEKKVKIFSPQRDLSYFYKKIDVLILYSKKLEGFGIVLIEAMSFGIPVIVANNSVFFEIVKNNYNGIVDQNNLVNSMLKFFNEDLTININKYITLSNNARKEAFKYDINIIIDEYIHKIYL